MLRELPDATPRQPRRIGDLSVRPASFKGLPYQRIAFLT